MFQKRSTHLHRYLDLQIKIDSKIYTDFCVLKETYMNTHAQTQKIHIHSHIHVFRPLYVDGSDLFWESPKKKLLLGNSQSHKCIYIYVFKYIRTYTYTYMATPKIWGLKKSLFFMFF